MPEPALVADEQHLALEQAGSTALIESPRAAAPQRPPDDISGTWRNTWIASQLDAPDNSAWHWQTPDSLVNVDDPDLLDDFDVDDDTAARWIRRMQRRNGLRHFMSRLRPFGWTERSQTPMIALRRRARFLITTAVILAVAAMVGYIGYLKAVHASSDVHLDIAPTPSDVPSSIIIVPPAIQQEGTPTPAQPAYQIGAWASNSTPGSPGSVKVFVQIVHQGVPVPNLNVSLSVSAGSIKDKSQKTDSDGIATFTVSFGGFGGNTPIFVTATALTSDGIQLSAQTTFTPRPGGGTTSSSSSAPTQDNKVPKKHKSWWPFSF